MTIDPIRGKDNDDSTLTKSNPSRRKTKKDFDQWWASLYPDDATKEHREATHHIRNMLLR